MSEIIKLTVTNGQPTTTSLAIAERFGKRHDNVLQSIQKLECSEEFRLLNFQGTSRTVPGPNGATRLEAMYAVTKDGFMFLAMGFTGKEAAAWKERFIAAFNAMERQLLENAAAQQIPQPNGQLFLSHTADIMVAADRTFRAGVRSGKHAGLTTAQSIRRANRLAYLKTGINMLEELQATDHLEDLEKKKRPRPMTWTNSLPPLRAAICLVADACPCCPPSCTEFTCTGAPATTSTRSSRQNLCRRSKNWACSGT